MPTTFAPDKAFLGIAPEVTPGTAVAMTATIPFEKCDFEDKPKDLPDPSLRGSMSTDYAQIQGVLISDFTIDGLMYVDTFQHLLSNILGDRTTTGASDPFAHATALLNSGNGQPKTHTLTYSSGIPASTGARVYTSACLSDLTLKWDAAAQLCKFTAKGLAWGSAVAGAGPTAAPSAVPPLASWRGVVGLGGVASGGTQILTPETLEIDFKRKLEAHYTLSGAQQPYVIQRGALSCGGKMTVVAADESPETKLMANTQEQLQVILGNGISAGSAGARIIQIDANLIAYKSAKLDQSKTASRYTVTYVALANSTNVGASGGLSPVKVTVTNGTAGTVY